MDYLTKLLANEFIGARKLRNLLVHEYMTEPRLFHEALITAKSATESLFRVVAAIKTEAITRGLLSPTHTHDPGYPET